MAGSWLSESPILSARLLGTPGDAWDPIILAKEVASLDRLCDGRFLFGVGAGWNRQEMASHGTDPSTRMALLTDRVRAMREICTADEAEYHGGFAGFDPIRSDPIRSGPGPGPSSGRIRPCW